MPRKGIQDTTIQKYLEIQSLVESGGLKTAVAIAAKTGYSRACVYRALRYLGIRLERSLCQYTRELDLVEPELVLSPQWAAEFRGFFFGEGYIAIQNHTQNWRPIMTINLRADDELLLRDIKTHLGGSVWFRERDGLGRNGHSQFRWTAAGWGRIKAILERCGFLNMSLFPAKKMAEIRLVYDAILARIEMPYHLSEENADVLRQYHSQIIKVRQFSYSG